MKWTREEEPALEGHWWRKQGSPAGFTYAGAAKEQQEN